MLYAGTVAMAQVERSANRIYGIRHDRPAVRRYLRAFLLYLSAGVLLLAGLVLVATGAALGSALGAEFGWTGRASVAFAALRWVVGIAIVGVAITLVFRLAPNRRQPRMPWLGAGMIVSVVSWVLFTAGLALFYGTNGSASNTYGPVLGVIVLLVWAFLSSLAVHLGLAFAAQLEWERAVRSGAADAAADLIDLSEEDERSGPPPNLTAVDAALPAAVDLERDSSLPSS
jgi:YihY family inner membrane protein